MSDERSADFSLEVASHATFLRALAATLTMRSDAADDAVQDTLLAAMRAVPVAERGLRAWLTGTLKRSLWKRARGEARRRTHESRGARPESSGPDDIFLLESITRAVARIDEPYRATILHLYYRGKSADELASECGVPSATIRTRHRRALEQLRAALDREFGGDRATWRALMLPFLPTDLVLTGSTIGVKSAAAAAALLFICGIAVTIHRMTVDDVDAIPVDAVAATLTDTRVTPRRATPIADASAPTPETSETPIAASRPTAAPATMRVRVLWKDNGRPAQRIGVWATTADERRDRDRTTGITDADGIAILRLPNPGHASVGTDGGGEIAEQFEIESGETTDVSIALEHPAKISGIVVDPAGQPVAGASIWISVANFVDCGQVVTESAEDGTFEIEDTADRSRIVAATSNHFGPSRSVDATPGHGGSECIRLVLAKDSGTLIGRVVDTAGRPIADADVECGADPRYRMNGFYEPNGKPTRTPPPRRMRTDRDGRFAMKGLATTRTTEDGESLFVRADGFGPAMRRTKIEDQKTSEIEITLGAPAVVRGKVTDENHRPIAGVAIRLVNADGLFDDTSHDAHSDTDGAFIFDGLAAQRFVAEAVHAGRVAVKREITIGFGETFEWTIVLPRAPSIRGRVVDAQGSGIGDIAVRIAGDDAREDAHTDDNGAFEISAADTHPKTLEVRVGAGDFDATKTVTDVVPGGPEVLIVLSDAERAGITFQGKVQDAEGTPIKDAWIIAWREGTNTGLNTHFHQTTGVFTGQARTEGRYNFDLHSVAFGERRLGTFDLSPGDQKDLGTLTIAYPGYVTVVIDDPNKVASEASYIVFVSADGLRRRHGGRLESAGFKDLPFIPGTLEIEVGGPGIQTEQRTIVVESRQPTTITFTVKKKTE